MNSNSTTQPAILGKGISKTFKDFWGRKKVSALNNIDIEIIEGSIFGLLGPNGAGKSTLIKLILGHLYPSTGKLMVLGKDPRDVKNKSKIGYLPERMYLYKNLTAFETLKYFGAILNLSKEQINSRALQLLEMVGLEHAQNRMIGEFSHGMGRRLGLAQALLNDPSFLILDEPTAGLDPIGCREVKDLILTLGKRGKTILLTSHLLADVESVCSEILLLYGGKTQAHGSMEELLHKKNKIQLQFPKVSEETLQEAKEALSKEIHTEKIMVSAPSESLERYFLQVVAASNEQEKESFGAKMGKGVAEYLQDKEYKPPSILTKSERFEKGKKVDEGTLTALVEGDPSLQDNKVGEKSKPEVDQETLKNLTGGNEENKKMQKEKSKKLNKDLLDDLTKKVDE